MKYASSLPDADPVRQASSSAAIGAPAPRPLALPDTPAVRTHVADVLIDAPDRAKLLVAAMKAGTVPPWSLGFWQKQDLVLYRDPDIRTSARALLEQDPLQRAATIKRYAAALDLGGEPTKGEQVFTRVCAPLSRARRPRRRFGPISPPSVIVRRSACWETSCFPVSPLRRAIRRTSSSGQEERRKRACLAHRHRRRSRFGRGRGVRSPSGAARSAR